MSNAGINETIVRANLANILKKLKAGKTLSASERAAVSDDVSATRLNKVGLCRRLDISRPTLDKYLTISGSPIPDHEGKWVLEEIADFISRHASKVLQPENSKQWKEEKLRLESERITIDIEARKDELARSRGEHISKSEIEKTIVPLMAELGSLLRQKFEVELPSQYRGKAVADCVELNAKAIDEIVERFRVGSEKFKTQAAA